MAHRVKQDKTSAVNSLSNQRASDSSEVGAQVSCANFHFSGVRKHTSIRCDSNLWKEFRKVCKSNGFTTCDCLEKLVLGFLVGVNQMCHNPTTINVVVDAPRVVKRVRRKQIVFEDEVSVEKTFADVPTCDFCPKANGRVREAVASFKWRGSDWIVKKACRRHTDDLKTNPKWELVEDE